MKYFLFLNMILIHLLIIIKPQFLRVPSAKKEMIINGNFKEGLYLNQITYYNVFNIPSWSITNNQFEIGPGKFYNDNWPDNVYVLDLDVEANQIVSQVFNIDSSYTCQLTLSYAAFQKSNKYDGLYVNFNNLPVFNKNPIEDFNIKYLSLPITTVAGNNKIDIGALGVSNANGALISDVSIKCPDFKNYIFFIAVGDYELYKDGALISSGQVTSAGKYISYGSFIMTNTLLEIKIKSASSNPRFIATFVYNYDNTNEYVINTNEHWIVDNFHAIELTDTDHTSNPNYGSILDTSAKWIKSSFSDVKETIFTMVTG